MRRNIVRGHGGNYVSVRYEDNSQEIVKRLKSNLNRGLFFAVRHLQNKIKHAIKEWGSEIIGSGLRRRLWHSTPGQPPKRQTGEFYESIQTFADRAKLTAGVYSDDPKAPTLEKGGVFQQNQDNNRRAKYKLINPFKKAIRIAARPVFGPIFAREYDKCVDIINKEGRKGF